MTVVIYWITRILNIVVSVMGLALFLRAVLPFFRVQPQNPVMRVLTTLTDPLVKPIRRVMGGSGIVWTGRSYVDLVPLVAIFVIWLAQAVLVRLLSWIAAPPLWILSPGEDLGRWLAGIINLLFQIYAFLLLVRVLLEWIRISYTQPLMRFLWDVTEPVLAPIRRRLPVFAGLDFSPIAAILLLAVVQALLVALVQAIF